MRCGNRDDVHLWLADVQGSLELGGIPWPVMVLPDDLPRLIPVIGGGIKSIPDWPAYAVRWERLLGRDGTSIQRRWVQGKHPSEVLGAKPGTKVIATLIAPDPPIETFWTNQHKHRLYDELAKANFDLVIGPNYSLYGDHPRFEHRINIKRSIMVASRMRQAGIPAVPHIYVWRDTDIESIAEWAIHYDLDTIAVNWQTFRKPVEWDQALARYIALRDRLPIGIKWYIVGSSMRERLQTLVALFNGVRILTVRPYEAAVHGHRLLPTGGEEKWPALPPDLFAENIRTMASAVQG